MPELPAVQVAISDLHPHPRNYRHHPDDQVAHLAASIKRHGFFRNVVVARGNVILAGHGVVEAATQLGYTHVPAVQLDYDPDSPEALNVLTLDNELGRFAETDDRALTELLRELSAAPDGLLGTGYDDTQLSALLITTRDAAEIPDFDAAAEWVGMPEYNSGERLPTLVVSFASFEDRDKFFDEFNLTDRLNITHRRHDSHVWSARWPDVSVYNSSMRWEEEPDA